MIRNATYNLVFRKLKSDYNLRQLLDYIIVGQGLAGSLLAFNLLLRKQRILIIDQGHGEAASGIAAGVISPITGRRFVKSWMIDELLPAAKACYRYTESQLGIRCYEAHKIIRILFNSSEENDWLARSAEPAYEKYIGEGDHLDCYTGKINKVFNYGELLQSAHVNVPLLIRAFRDYFKGKHSLIENRVHYADLQPSSGGVTYRDYRAKRIIFCEGHQAWYNPYFKYLPFVLAKGEALIVRIPGLKCRRILKHRVFLVPLEDELFWVGSTYDWEFDDGSPSGKAQQYLTKALSGILKVPFEIISHEAAIRPTVRDRRPLLGVHPEYNTLCIFNGLGTKGASLAPFWAERMTDYLIDGTAISPEVDIRRFNAG